MTATTPPKAPNPRRVITGEVRLAFVSVDKKKPRAKGSDKMSYQATLLIPPTTDMKPFVEAVRAAMIAKFSKEIPLRGDRANPIRKAEAYEYNGYEKGWYVIPTNSDLKPPVVGRDRLPVTDESRVYSGVWASVVVDAFAWDHVQGGKGVSFELKAIQLLRDGTEKDPGGARLDGRGKPVDPNETFQALEMPAESGSTEDALRDLLG